MRDFSKISCAIWQSQKFRNLSDKGRLLYLYLHTCPHVNSIGCYYLPKGYISADLGWNDSAVDRAMTELSTGLIEHNSGLNLIKINRFLEHSPITNKSHAIGATKKALSLPECPEKHSIINELTKQPYCAGLKELQSYRQACDRPVNTPPPTETQTDIKESNTKVLPKKARRIDHEFKTDFSMPAEYREFAISQNVNPEREWEKFIDYWKAKSGQTACKLDWLATWRNWCRNSADRGGGKAPTVSGSGRASGDATIAGARMALDRRRAKDRDLRQSEEIYDSVQ